MELGGEPEGSFMTSFSLPDSIPELYKLIKDMKVRAEKDEKNITMMLEKINDYAKKF